MKIKKCWPARKPVQAGPKNSLRHLPWLWGGGCAGVTHSLEHMGLDNCWEPEAPQSGRCQVWKKRHWFSLLYSTLPSASWLCTQPSPPCPTHTVSLVCLCRPGSYLVPSAPDTQDSSCINSTPSRCVVIILCVIIQM